MIITNEDKRLSMVCNPVKHSHAKIVARQLEKEWNSYQKEHPKDIVVGLAAPQIGQTVRMFRAFNDIFINPQIVRMSEETAERLEGCCSLADIYSVERSLEVTLIWHTLSHKLMKHTFLDNGAFIVQHEMDHLNGIIISDKGAKYVHDSKPTTK